jgi:carboxymethylenebutenolidase
VLADLDACVAWAKEQGGDTARLGITGFCWGGRITWLYAAHQPGLKAAVAWYGRLTGPTSALQPKQPVDQAAHLYAPVLGLYGGRDQGIPLDTVDKMQEALYQGNSAAKASSFHVYPDVGHAFHADYRPSYVEAAAENGWQRCIKWFKDKGVA